MSTTTIQTAGIFTGYTLTELRALILRILRQGDTSRYSPTAGTADYDWIDDAINRGQEDFARQTQCLRTYALIQLKGNYRTYRLPSDFIDMMAVYYYSSLTSYSELIVTTVEELNNLVSDWRTSLGTPLYIYVDKVYGSNWMFGVYPIPETDGEVITFDSDYGSEVEWVCPVYTYTQEYTVILNMTSADSFYLNKDAGLIAQPSAISGDLWMEYYRLPVNLTNTVQYPEIPKEYHKALAYYAAYDLLQHNPEDSAEFKRSVAYQQRFDNEVKTYTRKRKRPLSAQNLRARPTSWTWLNRMDWYAGLP